MFNEEIDLPVLAQLSEEQLSRMGVRTMGQRVRILNAAKEALAASDQVEENVIESVGLSESDGEDEARLAFTAPQPHLALPSRASSGWRFPCHLFPWPGK